MPDSEINSLAEAKDQASAKRALTIAATGGHNLLMVGTPSTGKTMLASRLASLIPQMTLEESLQVASIASVSRQLFEVKKWRKRPFRKPHHTASAVARVGDRNPPKSREICLAHNGVLFLDEVPEYPGKCSKYCGNRWNQAKYGSAEPLSRSRTQHTFS